MSDTERLAELIKETQALRDELRTEIDTLRAEKEALMQAATSLQTDHERQFRTLRDQVADTLHFVQQASATRRQG